MLVLLLPVLECQSLQQVCLNKHFFPFLEYLEVVSDPLDDDGGHCPDRQKKDLIGIGAEIKKLFGASR